MRNRFCMVIESRRTDDGHYGCTVGGATVAARLLSFAAGVGIYVVSGGADSGSKTDAPSLVEHDGFDYDDHGCRFGIKRK